MCAEPAKTQGWFDPRIWNYALMTGLKPSTIYYYRVGSNSTGWSIVQSFITAPAPGPNAAVNVFLFAGELLLAHLRIHHASVGIE